MKAADKKAREWTKQYAQAKLPDNTEDDVDEQVKNFLKNSAEVDQD